jgi:hypothetical protein
MRYWFDTEFIEDGRTIDLISIGIVAEDGRELYAESLDADLSRANEWVKENVIAHLWSQQADKRSANRWSRDSGIGGLLSRKDIAREIAAFCDPATYGRPELWAYYADYDWVALCQLFGRMIDLPKGWPMFCRDLKQFAVHLGDPTLPKQEGNEHHALADARWNRDTWHFLRLQATKSGEPALGALVLKDLYASKTG